MKERRDSDEHYVIDLCDRVLGMKAERQYNKFPFLRGDTGRPLAVDAFYPELKLVIEYHERQHSEAVKFFDRRMTPSGCLRGEQRRRYDDRRRVGIPRNGYRLLVIDWRVFGPRRRLRRDAVAHEEIVRSLLAPFIQ